MTRDGVIIGGLPSRPHLEQARGPNPAIRCHSAALDATEYTVTC